VIARRLPRLLTLLWILILAGSGLCAPAGSDIAATVAQRYKSLSRASADFELEIWWAVREKTEKKKGSFAFAPGSQFRVSLPGFEYMCDGSRFYSFNKAARQVVIDPASAMDPAALPSSIIRTCLSYEYDQISRTGSLVELAARMPPGGTGSLAAVSLKVDAASGTVKAIITRDRSGNRSTYTLTKFVTGSAAKLPSFRFVVPKGVSVVDKTQ